MESNLTNTECTLKELLVLLHGNGYANNLDNTLDDVIINTAQDCQYSANSLKHYNNLVKYSSLGILKIRYLKEISINTSISELNIIANQIKNTNKINKGTEINNKCQLANRSLLQEEIIP